jgi:hypothetical protein
VDVEAGFSPVNLIQHDTPVTRPLQIGRVLVAVSDTQITTHRMRRLGETAGALDLQIGSDVGLADLTDYSPSESIMLLDSDFAPPSVRSKSDAQKTFSLAPRAAREEDGTLLIRQLSKYERAVSHDAAFSVDTPDDFERGES